MYAAAGGASLASRQARQRQRQQKKTQQLQAKLHPPKAPGLAVTDHGVSTPTRQSRQFHQLSTNYLRTPQPQVRKLSAGYTAQSKLLLPIEEGDTQSVLQMRMHSHAHGHIVHSSHSHAHQHQHPHHSHLAHYTGALTVHPHRRPSPRLVHRHSGSNGTGVSHSHMPKSATATIPLALQVETTPPKIQDDLSDAAAERQPLTKDVDSCEDYERRQQIPTAPLERKCSVYRMKRSDAFELDSGAIGGVKRQLKELQFSHQHQRYEPLLFEEPHTVFKGFQPPSFGRKTQVCAYCEEGICVCEHIECAQGRAAWLERGRRCSVQETQHQAACHRRWVKRNRIQDASLGGSSDDEDLLGVLRGPSTFANTFLYVGLGTIALGLVIAFVGTGEKGFKTVELRLIGPSLIGLGFICCILRILFCICPSHCISSTKDTRQKTFTKSDADHTTSLLRSQKKRVSIARNSHQQRYPFSHKRTNTKMLNEGMEALRQIATTSLFMQNEQKPLTNRIVPIINEPESSNGNPLEMKKLDIMRSEVDHTLANIKETNSDQNQIHTKSGNEGITAPADALRQQNDVCNADTVANPSESDTSSGKLLGHVAIHQINTPEQSLSQLPSTSSEAQKMHNSLETNNQMETSLVEDKYHFERTGHTLPLTPPTSVIRIHKPFTAKHLNKSSAPDASNAVGTIKKDSIEYKTALANTTIHKRYTGSSIRGPLGMPTHLLHSSSTNSFSSSEAAANPAKNSLPAHCTTALLMGNSAQENIPGQVEDPTKREIYAREVGVVPVSVPSVPCGSDKISLKFPASSSITYSDSSSTSSLNNKNVIYSRSFTSTSLSATAAKYEPELLLSPSKLGR